MRETSVKEREAYRRLYCPRYGTGVATRSSLMRMSVEDLVGDDV